MENLSEAADRMCLLAEQAARRPSRARIQVASQNLVSVQGLWCITGEEMVPALCEAPVVVGPIRSTWFEGSAMRITVHAAGDPSVEQRGTITAVEINGVPQWEGSGYQTLCTDAFATPGGCAVGIHLGIVSTRNMMRPLYVRVRNKNSNDIHVTVELYGKPLNEYPETNEGSD